MGIKKVNETSSKIETVISRDYALTALCILHPLEITFDINDQNFYVWYPRTKIVDGRGVDISEVYGFGKTLNEAALNYVRKINGNNCMFDGDEISYKLIFYRDYDDIEREV